MTSKLVAVTRFTEPDELPHMMPQVMLRVLPVYAGSFSAFLITIRLGEIVFQAGTCAPAVIMAQAEPGVSVVQMPFAGTETFILNGRPLSPGLFGLYGGCATLERVSQQTTSHAALVLPTEKVESLLMVPSASPLLRSGEQALAQAQRRPWQRAICLFESIAQTVEADADAFLDPESRRSLRESLAEAVREVILGDQDSGPPRHVRTSPARRRIVNATDEYLLANCSRPIYTEDICTVLNISPARLAEAFRESFGITPHRFLKLRRLAMVRAALRDREGVAPLIRSVAHAHGFWHLGQFASDYRAMYGETPSETLTHTRGRTLHDAHVPGSEGNDSAGNAWLRHAWSRV